MDREAWRAAIHGVAKSRTWLSDWSDLIWSETSESEQTPQITLTCVSIMAITLTTGLQVTLHLVHVSSCGKYRLYQFVIPTLACKTGIALILYTRSLRLRQCSVTCPKSCPESCHCSWQGQAKTSSDCTAGSVVSTAHYMGLECETCVTQKLPWDHN